MKKLFYINTKLFKNRKRWNFVCFNWVFVF